MSCVALIGFLGHAVAGRGGVSSTERFRVTRRTLIVRISLGPAGGGPPAEVPERTEKLVMLVERGRLRRACLVLSSVTAGLWRMSYACQGQPTIVPCNGFEPPSTWEIALGLLHHFTALFEKLLVCHNGHPPRSVYCNAAAIFPPPDSLPGQRPTAQKWRRTVVNAVYGAFSFGSTRSSTSRCALSRSSPRVCRAAAPAGPAPTLH